MKVSSRYLIITAVVLIVWNSNYVYPLKLFTVFLHELGHAFMSVVFGQGLKGISINAFEGGITYVLPKGLFSSIMIANGGYLGSLFFGILILLLGRTWFRRHLLSSIALLLLYVSIKFAASAFTLIYSIAFAVFILVLYLIDSEVLNVLVIDVIGITGITYTIYDIFVDTILLSIIRPGGDRGVMTDAMQLERITGIPALGWGMIWLMISILAVKAVLAHTGMRRNNKNYTL